MDNWAPAVVYQMALERHTEDIARGAVAQQLARLMRRQGIRSRLANALVALAARLIAGQPTTGSLGQPAREQTATA